MTLASASERLDPVRWLGWPTLLCVLGALIFATPIRIFGLEPPEPIFPMALAFAWALLRPSVLAPFVLLGLGLFLDNFLGGALGLWPLSLLAAYGVTFLMRRVLSSVGGLGRAVGYAVACAVAMGVAVLVVLFTGRSLPDPLSILWQYLASLALFPLAHGLVERFEDADVRFR